MLFDATLAVSRTAYCIGHRGSPDKDPFVLQHKGEALRQLRKELQSTTLVPSEAVIFTVSRMLSVSYMSMDNESFEAHFAALQRIAQRYMLHKSAEDQMARVVESRLKAWTPLFEYRQAQNPLIPSVQNLALDNVHATYVDAPLSDELSSQIANLPPGFSELALQGALCIETIAVLSTIQSSLADLEGSLPDQSTLSATRHRLIDLREQIIALLASLELSSFETQLSHALLALCISIFIIYIQPSHGEPHTATDHHIRSSLASNPPLERLAKAFLYLKYSGAATSPTHTLCLQWAALALGASCFLIDEPELHVRQKGHIALISISERLLPSGAGGEDDEWWERLAEGLRGAFFWPERLVREWRRSYLATMWRQREWEGLGLLRIGMPSTDKIEYMVLR
jgi:hypothetical protein